jgi:hypothetical protein
MGGSERTGCSLITPQREQEHATAENSWILPRNSFIPTLVKGALAQEWKPAPDFRRAVAARGGAGDCYSAKAQRRPEGFVPSGVGAISYTKGT